MFDSKQLLEIPILETVVAGSKSFRSVSIKVAREKLRKRLLSSGDLVYRGHALARGALLKFQRQDGTPVNVRAYVALTRNRYGQSTFQIRHLQLSKKHPEIHWVVCVATEFDTAYAYRCDELLEPDPTALDGDAPELCRGRRRPAAVPRR